MTFGSNDLAFGWGSALRSQPSRLESIFLHCTMLDSTFDMGTSARRRTYSLRRDAALVAVLEVEHPARVLGRQGARLVEQLHVLGREREVGRGQVVDELLARLGAEDDARDEGARELPRERDAGDRRARALR